MNNIYVLTVWNTKEEEGNDFYFSTLQKANDFINDNFKWDFPMKRTSDLFEGRLNQYVINNWIVDQERL